MMLTSPAQFKFTFLTMLQICRISPRNLSLKTLEFQFHESPMDFLSTIVTVIRVGGSTSAPSFRSLVK